MTPNQTGLAAIGMILFLVVVAWGIDTIDKKRKESDDYHDIDDTDGGKYGI